VSRAVCEELSSDEPEVNGGRIRTPSERTGSNLGVGEAVVDGAVVDDVVVG